MQEEEYFNKLLDDLKKLLAKDEIRGSELDDFKESLETKEVKNYIENIEALSKPESALRETFFNENSPFIKSLFPNFRVIPEPSIKRVGFLDYKLEGYGMNIIIELKPFFEPIMKKNVLEKVKYNPLDWQQEKKQIYKYIREEDYKYAILTDLKKWYFFSKSKVYNEEHIEFIYSVPFDEFINELKNEDNLVSYLERIEHLSVKENLDKKFFDSLKEWISKLGEVKFTCNENDKIESIVYLINKFIFIQTLDDYGIIDINKIRKEFTFWEQKYHAKGDYYVLKTFLEEINKEFYLYYDTELFANHQFMDFVDIEDDTNLNKLSKTLKFVLGLGGQTSTRWINGISHYNFKFIDEDILGKAYETFLAEVRKEQGIYYTPPYITKYISENTVGNLFDEKINNFKDFLEKREYEKAKAVLSEVMQVKILDPACGSGSFLIKSLRLISKKYQEIAHIFDEQLKKYGKMNGLKHEHPEDYEQIRQILGIFKTSSKRELLSKILIRHIHGNDLDAKALEVAKVNLWLEVIKLAPQDFKTEVIGHFHNTHVLPNLSMNLENGDSLVGLPEKETIEFMKNNFHKEIIELFKERNKYLQDTTNTEHIGNVLAIKKVIQKKLNEEFEKYLTNNKLPIEIKDKTLPFHWALEFWYCFFNEDGTPKQKDEHGFDAVIGNPPYIRVHKQIEENKIFLRKIFVSPKGDFDIYIVFYERGLKLLKLDSYLSYITPDKFFTREYGEYLRNFILKNYKITEILDVSRCSDVFDAATYPTIIHVKRIYSDFIESLSETRIINNPIKVIKILGVCEPEFKNLEQCKSMMNVRKKIYQFVTEKVYGKLFNQEDFLIKENGKIHINIDELSEIIEKLDNYQKIGSINNLDFFCGTPRAKDYHGWKDYVTEKEYSNSLKYVVCRNISRYVINWNLPINSLGKKLKNSYLKCDENIINEERINQFKYKPKIIIRGNDTQITAAVDNEGFSFVGAYAIIQNEYNPFLLCGLLNSALLKAYFFNKNPSIKVSGDYFSINKPHVEELPLPNSNNKQSTANIICCVEKIMLIDNLKIKLIEFWKEYSSKYKNNQKLLREILIEDKREIRGGNFRSLWATESSLYPDDSNDILKEKFGEFKIVCEDEKILKILGINANYEKELIKLKFTKKELRDLVYLELIISLESNNRINSLKDILNKTAISIIQPNSWDNSINLIKGTENKFKEWAKENKVSKELATINLSEMEHDIEETDAKIDANVFKLYELDEEEIKTVMDSLSTPQYYQEKVFNFFKKLK